MKSFFIENWFKFGLLLSLILLVSFGGFYLKGKNELEAEKQHQAVLDKQEKTQTETKISQTTVKKTIAKQPTNVGLEREKCHYKYLVSREWDSEADFSLIIDQTNYVIKYDQSKNLAVDSEKILKTLQDDYFNKKYEACLNNIKLSFYIY